MATLGGIRVHDLPARAALILAAACALVLCTGGRARAQQTVSAGALDIARLARGDSDSVLVSRARAAPDDARDALRHLLSPAATGGEASNWLAGPPLPA